MRKIILFLMLVIMSSTMTTTLGFSFTAENTLTLKMDDYILLGKYNDIPILWKCVDVDENGMLILSDKILCRKPFDMPSMVNGSHVRRSQYGGLYSGSNYWGDSNIRSWLNSDKPASEIVWLCGNSPYTLRGGSKGYDTEKGFLADGNFTQAERDVMKAIPQKSLLDQLDVELAVSGSTEAWGTGDFNINIKDFMEHQYDEICFEYVTDKVFLLDIKQYEKVASQDIGEVRYWLRTPFGRNYQYSGRDTYYSGYRVLTSSHDSGYVNADIAELDLGIRPAFYLEEDNAMILSGSGTAEDPYVVTGREISVSVDGTEVSFDQSPIVRGGVVYAPLRAIAEQLGAAVSWDEAAQKVTVQMDGRTVDLTVDMQEMYVDGVMHWLPAPVILKGDRTLVPLQVLTGGFGLPAEWDSTAQTITITTTG